METQNEKLMEFKINIKELSNTLAHKRLKEILPDEIMIEDKHMTKYTEEGQIRFNDFYNEYWDEIADAMIYPCYNGEKFYTIFQKKKDKVYGLHEYEVIERVWDERSEEIYRLDPMRKMFRTKEEAEEYIKEITE
jgi:hypothetical protein